VAQASAKSRGRNAPEHVDAATRSAHLARAQEFDVAVVIEGLSPPMIQWAMIDQVRGR